MWSWWVNLCGFVLRGCSAWCSPAARTCQGCSPACVAHRGDSAYGHQWSFLDKEPSSGSMCHWAVFLLFYSTMTAGNWKNKRNFGRYLKSYLKFYLKWTGQSQFFYFPSLSIQKITKQCGCILSCSTHYCLDSSIELSVSPLPALRPKSMVQSQTPCCTAALGCTAHTPWPVVPPHHSGSRFFCPVWGAVWRCDPLCCFHGNGKERASPLGLFLWDVCALCLRSPSSSLVLKGTLLVDSDGDA